MFKPPKRLCAKCGKDLHDVIIDTGQTFYDKDTDKVYCSVKCFPRKIRKIPIYRDTYSEVVAKQYLWDLGLEPNKCNKKGYPDFKCKDNIWIEVKTLNTGLNKNQIKRFKELLSKGHDIYLLYINEKKIDFFKLNEAKTLFCEGNLEDM